MPERINKLQPDRTLYLRGFDSFAAAAMIHNASPTGFQISGVFRDPADFAVAVLYDADNAFEHPSIRYLPDFDFAGLVLGFSLLYTDGVQPIDSPKFNWIDWATLDCVRADGSTAQIPLWDNAMLADPAFPAASAILNVVATPEIGAGNRLTLWYENLAFDFVVPGGISGSAAYSWQSAPSTASISVGSTTYTYNVTTAGGEDGPTIAAGVAAAAAADPQVLFSPSGSSVVFTPRVNTGAVVDVSGYSLWLVTDLPSTVIANAFAAQINGFNWVAANAMFGLIANASGSAITLTAGCYGSVSVTGNVVTWAAPATGFSSTKFSGITPGSAFFIDGTRYTVAGIQSPTQLTLTTAPPVAGGKYLAPRGGRDGNMIGLYALATAPSTLAFDQSQIQLAGGSSAVTWNCSLDFTALGIDQLRQCWLTFAPSLADGAAYTTTEWLATFSNWMLSDPNSIAALKVAGPGSVRIEQDAGGCVFTSNWTMESGFYSKYFATAASALNESVTINYTCQFTHNLYLGTSLYGLTSAAAGLTLVTDTLYNASFNGNLYSDRGVAGIRLDGDTETLLDCRMNTGSALVTRRLLRSSVAPGKHTVTIRVQEAGFVYFDFLEAAVLSDVPDALPPRTKVSPALDFDTDQTYKVSPSRLLWMMNKLGYAGPVNEYLGVFWWNQRKAVGGSFSTAQVTLAGTFAGGDSVVLEFNPPGGTQLGKSVFPTDTPATIAAHFAAYVNGSLTGPWASASGGVLTITGRSPASPYTLALSVTLTSALGTATINPTVPAAGVYQTWDIDDTVSPPINRGVRDWHADFYAQCATQGLQVVSACSLELVNPPDGYAALFPDSARTPVSTATGFGTLNSTQCAVGSSKMLAYQKAVYRNIAQLQSAAGLTPSVQYGEFLWWYFAGPSGMGYYDDETMAAAQTALGRPLYIFATPNDDPTVNSSADAIFLRNRLRDHVAALVADIRSAYPTVMCEVLWPYDVNYPTPLTTGGGQLNRFINLPVEWQLQSSSGLDRMKVEALAFATGLRNLDLAREAIQLFPDFGWPRSALRYLVPVFGSANPWNRELALVWAAGLPVANFWALDHICLYNLTVPEPPLDRRSVIKTG
jgi:hypothetical protein